MVSEQDLNVYLSKFDKKYWLTYKVLDILQKVHFHSNVTSAPHRLLIGVAVPMFLLCCPVL